MDEVGRGALAGPVAVGVCTFTPGAGKTPIGLADSKLLTAPRRRAMVSSVARWGFPCSVGFAAAHEVDRVGIMAALQLAGLRALESLHLPRIDAVLLDGPYDWLSPRDLLVPAVIIDRFESLGCPRVHARVKADRTSSTVAAASICAKVSRDYLMASLPDPGYGWAGNKGYASAAHRDAIRRLGPSSLHRISWDLLGAGKNPRHGGGRGPRATSPS